MLGDISPYIDDVVTVIKLAWLLFIAYRALEMGRAFTNRLYRSRAFWSAALVLTAFLETFSTAIPTSDPTLSILEFVVPVPVLVIAIALFVDRTILVARESDFFHRDILRWSSLRLPSLGAGIVTLPVVFLSLFFLPEFNTLPSSGPLLAVVAFDQFLIVFPLVFGYWVIALIIGARRTPDLTLKRHIRFLGIALGLFVLNFLIGSLTNGGFPSDLLDDATSLLSVYAIYISIMSLSPLGRVEKEVSWTSAEVSPSSA